jgi:hypothetical protein
MARAKLCRLTTAADFLPELFADQNYVPTGIAITTRVYTCWRNLEQAWKTQFSILANYNS